MIVYSSGVNCGSLSGHFWRMEVTLEPLWGHFGITLAGECDFRVTLESLFVYDGDFVATLGSFCGHYLHLRAVRGTLWEYFGSTCGIWGRFGITLR